MKLTMTRVLTPLAALAFTLGAQATAVSTDGFETYAAGSSVTNATGWSFTAGGDGAPDASAVTAYGEAAKPTVLPDGMAAGDNFLKLSTEDGILFRNMDGDAGESVDLYQGLYVDTDVQFTLTDKSDRPAATSDDKFIIWLEADEDAGTTNLCVWAREYQVVEGTGIAANSNKVYKLNSGAIVPGSWHRLTVKACSSINTDPAIPGFQVYLDGSNTPLSSNVDGVESSYFLPDDQLSSSSLLDADAQTLFNARTFFPAMADTLETLTKVGFSGEGKIDNLVVTRDLPGFEEPTTVRFDFDMDVIDSIDIASLGVALTSTNDTIAIPSDATFTFAINWKSGYSASMFNIATTADGYASIDGYEVTAGGFGLGVITVATTAKDTTDVTFNWSALNEAMGDRILENTAISFTIGETVYDADLEEDRMTINGVKTGTDILVTVTYSTQDWETSITPPACMTLSGSTLTLVSRPESGTALVSISTGHPAPPVATVDGVSYATFAEAFAAAKTAGKPVVLCDDVTLTEAQAVAANEAVTIDLNGNTITGAAGDAAFENAGTLTITDESQDHDGSVVAGESGSVVYNEGTLALVYGYYEGVFVNAEETFTITTDCTFDNDLGRSYTAPAGYEMAETYEDSGVYQLKLLTYTITYMNGGSEVTGLTPATYTVTNNVTLPTDLGEIVGVTLTGWKDGEDNDVADWSAGDRTGDLVLYAQTTPLVFEHTITYLNADGTTFTDWAVGYTAPASFSNEVVTLPVAANISLSNLGVQFGGWTNALGEAVADTTGLTADLTVYAKLDPLVPAQGTEPGAAVSGSPFATQAEAESAASSATVAVPAAVAAELTTEQQNAYKILFHAKVGEPVDGQYPVTMELTAEGAATIQSSADVAVAALATNLTAAATAAQTVVIDAVPGFYYSIETGTEVNNLAEPQQRTLATGDTVTLTMPTLGTKGFYRVKISYEQLSPAPNSGE